MNETPLLQLKAVSFGYTDEDLALKGVSVSFYPGEKIAVVGSNGAGKSTFFLCCNGVLTPSDGQIVLNGEAIGSKKKDVMRLRKAVGLVFQDPDDQILAATVEDEISFGPLNLGLDEQSVQQCVDEAIQSLSLEEYRTRPPHYLSGGEKKQVTIADILAMNPQTILFDEPTSSLDPKNTIRLKGVLEDLSNRGIALVVATHDIDFVYAWADRVLVFHDGTLLVDAPPLEVFSDKNLLDQAGLTKPLLRNVVECVCAYNQVDVPVEPPRTVDDLPLFFKELGL